MSSAHPRRAFTVIELLVVIAIVGILVATVGVAMRGGDRTAALQAGQSSLSSVVSAARAQAAIRMTDATVVIWGGYSRSNAEMANTYLRRAAILTHEDTDSDGNRDAYVLRGDVIDLPRGIYFVPPDLGSFPASQESASDWAGYRRTYASSTAPETLTVKRWNADTNSFEADDRFPNPFRGYRSITFDSQGRVQGASNVGKQLVIAVGETDDDGIRFINADSQRGLYLSQYGVPTIINEKEGLKN